MEDMTNQDLLEEPGTWLSRDSYPCFPVSAHTKECNAHPFVNIALSDDYQSSEESKPTDGYFLWEG